MATSLCTKKTKLAFFKLLVSFLGFHSQPSNSYSWSLWPDTSLVYFLSLSYFLWSFLGEQFLSSEAGSQVCCMHVLCLFKKQWVLKLVRLTANCKTPYKGPRSSKPGLPGECVPLSRVIIAFTKLFCHLSPGYTEKPREYEENKNTIQPGHRHHIPFILFCLFIVDFFLCKDRVSQCPLPYSPVYFWPC